ncbi:ABC transporter ATP-binding protein [Staphylospora marina]|uniref:ABC transporter ATP-binding protein n=1 Tax=Staphylospora marina TaxID=2490858 RepID=UPI000F5BC110|nr:ABC transporter ATP-binding protein [Staphylospora marina]
MTSPVIRVESVTQSYFSPIAETQAIRSVCFEVEAGEFLVIVGPSGCGKSTLLSLIAGLFPPTRGKILLFDREVRRPTRHTGYMLQTDGLLAWKTVEENVMLGLRIRRQATPENRKRALHWLERMGLSDARHRYPHELSGGMRQRVAIARTLAVDPDILLLDEPFSALDIRTKIQLEDLLLRTVREEKKTVILVTHDLEEALATGDRILIMGGKPGEIRRQLTIPESIRRLPPLESRNHPEFRALFRELWREVDAS